MQYNDYDKDSSESLLSLPSTATLSKSSLSPAFAFVFAVSQDLVDLLVLAYAMKILLPEGFTLTEGKALYDSTYDQAYNYGIMPTNFTDPTKGGMGMNENDSQEFAARTACNLVNNATFDIPLTTFTFTMMAILALAMLSILLKSFRLIFNHYAGNIDLHFPLSKEDCSAEMAIQSQASLKSKDDCPIILEKFYLNLAAGNAKKEQTFAYRMFSIPHRLIHTQCHSWLPNLAQLYSFAGVAVIAALYVASAQDVYNKTLGLSYYEQYKQETLQYLHNTTETGALCSSDDQELACYSEACASGSIYSTFAQMDHIGFNTQFWYWAGPIFAAAITPALDRFYKWRFGYDTELSPVFAFARAAGQDLPKLLVFNLAISELLSGGYAIYLGKPLYDRMYTTMFLYAVTPLPDGLGKSDDTANTYATYSAHNYFVDFMNKNMIAWTTFFTISLLIFSAIYFVARSCRLLKAHSVGIIKLDMPMTAQEQEQYLQKHPRECMNQYALPTFFEKYYLNHAVEQNDLRDTWSHWFYEKSYRMRYAKSCRWTPSFTDSYTPIKIGLITVLTATVILNVYINLKVQGVYHDEYEKKYNLMDEYDNCISDNQVMYCQSMAAQNGEMDTLNIFMRLMGGLLGQSLYLVPLVVIGSIFILSMIIKKIEYCNKNNVNNSDYTDFIERESENSDQRMEMNENGVVATPQNFFQNVKETMCCCMQSNNKRSSLK